ncbi:MAG: Purine nucleoside phosphorylase [Parcubacteria group bacterium GW2011_GWC1_41_7]|nr:MAG: Purine nucleoside phosphorylase [Parcubacteria group bacterium GW2011_GWC1_41_7]
MDAKLEKRIREKIREIPNWPKHGVSFKDITPLLEDKLLFSKVIDELAKPYLKTKIDKIVGIDARGFLLASALAYKLKTGVAIIRKKGKLPAKIISKEYSLEYASNTIEMHQDSILPGEKVLIIDDVLATGGTIKAALGLVKQLEGKVSGVEFLIELKYLNGRRIIKGQKVKSLISYGSPQKKQDAKEAAEIGLIGGSGFYQFFGKDAKEIEVDTEFGMPSDKITIGKIFGKKVAFLPRHGKKHSIPPHKVPYKANIMALKQLGVKKIIASSAAGSLQTRIKPGDFVLPDQFVDRTKNRDDTFFNGPKVAHIEMAYPYCKVLRETAKLQSKRIKIKCHPAGTAVVIEGPRFSTLADSLSYSKNGWDLINMTQYPEVVLAAEMGICYLNISIITDYDVGVYAKSKTSPVSIEQVLYNFKNNTETLKYFISKIIENIGGHDSCECQKKSERALVK